MRERRMAPRLTPVETEQVYARKHRKTKRKLLERITSFSSAREIRKKLDVGISPEEHDDLVENPYLFEHLKHDPKLITEIIVAEPEKDYDTEYAAMSWAEKRDALYHQIDVSADITKGLTLWAEQRCEEIWEMADHQLYQAMSYQAFRVEDPAEVNEIYAQSQRRGFRLAIHHFIQDLKIIRAHKTEFESSPAEYLKSLLEKANFEKKELALSFEDTVRVEAMPIGFLVYLSERDLLKIEQIITGKKFDKTSTRGRVWNNRMLKELNGKVAFVKVEDTEELTTNELRDHTQSTRDHELMHIAYAAFHERGPFVYSSDLKTVLEQIQKMPEAEQLDKHREFTKELVRSSLEDAQDEIIAYSRSYLGEGPLSIDQIGGDIWEKYLQEVKASNPSEEVYRVYAKAYRNYLKQTARYRWQVKTFDENLGTRHEKRMTREDMEAILHNTPIGKTQRLIERYNFVEEDLDQTSLVVAGIIRNAVLEVKSEATTTFKYPILSAVQFVENYHAYDLKRPFTYLRELGELLSCKEVPHIYIESILRTLQQILDIVYAKAAKREFFNETKQDVTNYIQKMLDNHQDSDDEEIKTTCKKARSMLEDFDERYAIDISPEEYRNMSEEEFRAAMRAKRKLKQ